MRPKSGEAEDQSEKLAELNKKILEVKKKIQLSGRFEYCQIEKVILLGWFITQDVNYMKIKSDFVINVKAIKFY